MEVMMSLIKWNDSYSTGIQKMDEQHKHWMEVINRFYDELNTKNFKDNTMKLLDDAIQYTSFHFSQEEELMAKHGYPHLEEQKKEHNAIKEKLNSYRDMLVQGKLNVSQPITREMKSWFNNHITNMDKEYGPFIR